MDEPTNFLDLDSVDSLIKAVNKFKGGLVVVTHNRDFLKRTVSSFLSIIPGAFLEFETMKDAERATYSFITALEAGERVDFQQAIKDNRGGGAIHNEDEQAIRKSRLNAQQQKAKDEADAIEAERVRLETLAIEKEKERLAKLAALKDNWVAGETCWAPLKGGWAFVEVVRNVPSMGCTVKTATGEMAMIEAKKLRAECPSGNPAPASKAAPGGGKGAARGGRGGQTGNNNGGGRGQTVGGVNNGRGGRGGNAGGNNGRGGRGGARK
jgi:hypothetical protein